MPGAVTRSTGLAIAVVMYVGAAAAFAQEPVVYVRRSAATGPNVTDVGVVRQRQVEIVSPRVLSDDARSGVMELDLFPDVSFRAIRQRLEPTSHGTSWVGTLDGYPQSSAIFVLVGDEVVGHVHAPFGFFRIARQPDDGYLVQQVDQAVIEQNDAIAPPVAAAAQSGAATASLQGLLDDGSVVDVLVAYTRDALNGFGTETRAQAAIDMIVAETDQSLLNSGVNTRVRLVHTARVDYAETGDSSLDLARLQAPGDGFLDDVTALRDLYQADLVAFIPERVTAGICGQSYLMPIRGGIASFGFSLTGRSCTGNGRAFAHEIGHNLGAHHDWYETADPGVSTYSKGFVSLAGRFLDVMAYSSLCVVTRTSCARLLAYSNPALTRDGHPMGVPVGTGIACTAGNIDNPPCDADVVRTLQEMAPVIARYRNSYLSITSRQILPGGSLRSANGRFQLVYQADGNVVLYDDLARTALWATHTAGTTPGELNMQLDGNLVLYDNAAVPRWSSGTSGNPNAYFVLQNDGNFVVYGANDRPVWSSGTSQ